LADISKINAVALANIAKLDAVLAANIAKVNGLVFTAGAAFLLDTYTGAAAGYSVRRLATSATVLLRVRRDTAGGTGDDDEADVAYDSNNIVSLDSAISNASVGVTATTLGQFLNVGTVGGTTYTNPDSLTVTASCYVDTWYDQAGSNDATQATETSQPQIHDGTVNTDLITENGKPAVQFDGSASWMQSSGFGTGITRYVTHVANVNGDGTGYENVWIFLTNTSPWTTGDFMQYYSITPASGSILNFNPAARDLSGSSAIDQQRLGTFVSLAAGTEFFIDGTSEDSATATAPELEDRLSIGQFQGNFAYMKFQEMVVWNSDESSNRTGIETNINSEYLIYQPTDAPTSGLLATYTGAAAAYSVRQLSDKAVIAMRIRRDSDDEETNIGWDTNGDLDTTAISDFCGTANGYVTRWWDQSTNGVHADQATDASQPQIYNGTAVITEHGKPALQGGSGVYLTQPSAVSVSDDLTLLAVADTSNLTTTQLILGVDTDTCATDTQIFTDTNGSRINGRSATCGFIHSTKSGNSSLFLGVLDYTNDELVARYDGSAQSAVAGLTETPTSIDWNIGANTSGTSNNLGTYQEVIIWLTAQSPTNAAGIETDIMTYFSIT